MCQVRQLVGALRTTPTGVDYGNEQFQQAVTHCTPQGAVFQVRRHDAFVRESTVLY